METIKLFAQDISKFAPLTEKHEKWYAYRVHANDDKALSILVCANLSLVLKVAHKVAKQTECPVEDLVQVGNMALIKAAKAFDETKGFRFEAFARTIVKRDIRAEALKTSARQLREVRFPDKNCMTYSICQDDNDYPLEEFVDENPTADLLMEQNDSRRAIRRQVRQLPSKERYVIVNRFGLDGLYERPFNRIADDLGCTCESIRKTYARALRMLQRQMPTNLYSMCA